MEILENHQLQSIHFGYFSSTIGNSVCVGVNTCIGLTNPAAPHRYDGLSKNLRHREVGGFAKIPCFQSFGSSPQTLEVLQMSIRDLYRWGGAHSVALNTHLEKKNLKKNRKSKKKPKWRGFLLNFILPKRSNPTLPPLTHTPDTSDLSILISHLGLPRLTDGPEIIFGDPSELIQRKSNAR